MNSANEFLSQFFELNTPVAGPGRWCFMNARKTLMRHNIPDAGKLLKLFPRLNRSEKFVAICVFSHLRMRDSIPRLISELASTDSVISGAAAGALVSIGGRKVELLLIQTLGRCRGAAQELVVVSALANLIDIQLADRVAKELGSILADTSKPPDLRAMAARGLGSASRYLDHRTRCHRGAIEVLHSALKDRSRDIRDSARAALRRAAQKR